MKAARETILSALIITLGVFVVGFKLVKSLVTGEKIEMPKIDYR